MRARASIFVACCATTGALLACGSPPQPVVAPPPAASKPPPNDDHSGFAGKDFTAYRSDRFGVTFLLPDRPAWTIVDRPESNSGWVVATHAASSTTVRVRRYEETSLVGRRECEMRAQLSGEMPKEHELEKKGFETLSDEPIHRPKGWDGRRWVAYEPRPDGSLRGHVYLVAGRAHSCLVLHVIADAKGDNEAKDLADRLELFSSRVAGSITVDKAASPDPLTPQIPNLAPTPGVP